MLKVTKLTGDFSLGWSRAVLGNNVASNKVDWKLFTRWTVYFRITSLKVTCHWGVRFCNKHLYVALLSLLTLNLSVTEYTCSGGPVRVLKWVSTLLSLLPLNLSVSGATWMFLMFFCLFMKWKTKNWFKYYKHLDCYQWVGSGDGPYQEGRGGFVSVTVY